MGYQGDVVHPGDLDRREDLRAIGPGGCQEVESGAVVDAAVDVDAAIIGILVQHAVVVHMRRLSEGRRIGHVAQGQTCLGQVLTDLPVPIAYVRFVDIRHDDAVNVGIGLVQCTGLEAVFQTVFSVRP